MSHRYRTRRRPKQPKELEAWPADDPASAQVPKGSVEAWIQDLSAREPKHRWGFAAVFASMFFLGALAFCAADWLEEVDPDLAGNLAIYGFTSTMLLGLHIKVFGIRDTYELKRRIQLPLLLLQALRKDVRGRPKIRLKPARPTRRKRQDWLQMQLRLVDGSALLLRLQLDILVSRKRKRGLRLKVRYRPRERLQIEWRRPRPASDAAVQRLQELLQNPPPADPKGEPTPPPYRLRLRAHGRRLRLEATKPRAKTTPEAFWTGEAACAPALFTAEEILTLLLQLRLLPPAPADATPPPA